MVAHVVLMHICTHIHYHKVLDSCIPLIYYQPNLFSPTCGIMARFSWRALP
jgi:hypothetical protein